MKTLKLLLAALPANVVPSKIRNYISKNYPANKITGWERDDRGQKQSWITTWNYTLILKEIL